MLTSLPTLEKGLETITTKGLQGFSDTLYTLVTTGKNGFASMVASMLDQLAKLIFQLGVVKPMLDSMQASMSSGGVSGSILGFLSSIGVGRSGGAAPASSGTQIAGDVVTAAADGADIGMPNSGKSILVGEKGPEMFIPKSTGTIIPNNKLNIGGGGGATQNLNFTHNITVQSTNGNMADTLEQGRQIQQMVDKQIKMTIARESMPGGSLSAAQRRY